MGILDQVLQYTGVCVDITYSHHYFHT